MVSSKAIVKGLHNESSLVCFKVACKMKVRAVDIVLSNCGCIWSDHPVVLNDVFSWAAKILDIVSTKSSLNSLSDLPLSECVNKGEEVVLANDDFLLWWANPTC